VPIGIKTDSSGNVYVGDQGNDRIQKFDSNGKFITKWGSTGSGDGQFQVPIGIAINSKGLVYVTDLGNSRVQVFAPS
jgi:DNA-binding beta-propeller fold protein YncE